MREIEWEEEVMGINLTWNGVREGRCRKLLQFNYRVERFNLTNEISMPSTTGIVNCADILWGIKIVVEKPSLKNSNFFKLCTCRNTSEMAICELKFRILCVSPYLEVKCANFQMSETFN